MQIKIGLIGDYDQTVPAHQAIPLALNLAAQRLGVMVTLYPLQKRGLAI